MNFSSASKALVNRLEKRNGLDRGVAYTYLWARANGHATYYFPDGYEILNEIPKSSIFDEKLDPDWVKEWIKLWPKQSTTGLSYAVSGSFPEVRKRFTKFLKGWSERFYDMGVDDIPLEDKLDKIQEATERYLAAKEYHNWEYTKKNYKFIIDSNGSELEQWIRNTKPQIVQKYRI